LILFGVGTFGNFIQGNYIGTDVTGTKALGNVQDGIVLQNVINNQIGGSATGAGNLISGNNANGLAGGNNGIYFTNAAWNIVQGNRIGTDVSGTLSLGNSWNAIYMEYANSNQIGGVIAGAGNLLSANGRAGIRMNKNGCWNVIQGNFIGTKADGINALANGNHGLDLDVNSTNNTIGGAAAGAGNVLAFAPSGFCGVRVRTGAFNNLISGNVIFSNGALGIDLSQTSGGTSAGVNPIVDPGSVAVGAANAGQNFPTLSNAYTSTFTCVRGNLYGRAGGTYTLQFFASPAGDASGYGEGQVFLGQTNITLGSTNFTVYLPVVVTSGWAVTATATDANNNTSEFSKWVTAIPVPPLQLARTNLNRIALSWTNNGGNFTLQQTPDLTPPPVWTTVTNLPVLVNNFWVTTLFTTNGSLFYRLLAP
jgi:titin